MSFDRLSFFLSYIATLFLAFLMGAIATYNQWVPYPWIQQADNAYHAWREQKEVIRKAEEELRTLQYAPQPVLHTKDAFPGYTLYTNAIDTKAQLIDMEGKVVHQWTCPFSVAFPNHPHIPHPLPQSNIHLFDAHLFPNGDILVTYEATGDTPYGYGLAKFDKNSRLIWSYPQHVNHTVSIGEDNKIYALVQNFIDADAIPQLAVHNTQVMGDWLVILTPEGKEIKRIFLTDAILNSPYRPLIRRKGWDILHPNSVVPLESKMHDAFPMVEPGQLLVSLRNISAIGIVDRKSGKLIWAKQGIWREQHDVEFVPDGTIMLFDNRGDPHQSRVLTYDPRNDATKIVFEGTWHQPFFTYARGMQQRLPNGDLLLVEARGGRLLEVNVKGDIVWQFFNPYRINDKRAWILSATRYSAEELPFLKDIKSVSAPLPACGTIAPDAPARTSGDCRP